MRKVIVTLTVLSCLFLGLQAGSFAKVPVKAKAPTAVTRTKSAPVKTVKKTSPVKTRAHKQIKSIKKAK